MRETTSPTPAIFVGIDVAKHRLDICILPTGERHAVPHDYGAMPALIRRLVELHPKLVCLEATGGLQTRVAGELAAAGFCQVSCHDPWLRRSGLVIWPALTAGRMGCGA
jgi:transposase